ncbi:SurA N-terminal domain-containing protein [Ornithinimicrobium cavernae]|uniref:SurA N-terminal domain-containing protein n=1 Tax=Ornithinimicrobium cavernae TaxID=2666047 RepID=UPI000D693241|nr:SurA N-terminal domain-containing protein [Ornithinimicrobium cavernae]
MRKTTWLTSLGLAVCLLGTASCSTDEQTGADDAGATQNASAAPGSEDAAQSAAPDGSAASGGPDGAAGTAGPDGQAQAPDLSDVPDVVAQVNDTEISKDEFSEAYQSSFEQASAQTEMTGQPVDEAALREQTVESLVSSELLLQASAEHGFEATPEDIDAELEELAKSSGMASGEEFLTALEEQGMTADEVDAEVEKKVKIDQLIEQEAKVEEPTEEELRALYDELSAQQGAGGAESGSGGAEVPPFEEVKEQLAAQLTSEKENEAVQVLLEDLRAEADVTVHL